MEATEAELNEMERQYKIANYDWEEEKYVVLDGGWDDEEVLRNLRAACTVTEKFGTICHDDGTIQQTITYQFHDKEDLFYWYEREMLNKEDKEIGPYLKYRICVHIDRMIMERTEYVKFINHTDAIKAYFYEGDEEE